MDDNAKFWDGVARRYAKKPIQDMATYEAMLDRTRHYLNADMRVLEIGCGTGTTALKLAGDVAHMTGSDVSGEMIAIAKEKTLIEDVTNADFVQAGVGAPGVRGAPFDAVLAFNLLHLIEDLPAALKHVHGLLKLDGVFISKTTCLKGESLLYPVMIPVMQWLGKAPYVRFLTRPELEAMIGEAGFELVEAFDYPTKPPGRFVVAKRVG